MEEVLIIIDSEVHKGKAFLLYMGMRSYGCHRVLYGRYVDGHHMGSYERCLGIIGVE